MSFMNATQCLCSVFALCARTFHLKLKKDNSVFAKDHMMKESDGSLSPVDTSFIYSGHLEGEHSLHRHQTRHCLISFVGGGGGGVNYNETH